MRNINNLRLVVFCSLLCVIGQAISAEIVENTTAPMIFSCFGIHEVKLATKDEKCKGIESLQVTSLIGGEELVGIYLPEEGRDKLGVNTIVDDGFNGPVTIHTSCSKPLEVGDIFGAYTITDLGKNYDDQYGSKGNEVEIKGTLSSVALIDLAADDMIYTIEDLEGYSVSFMILAGSFKTEGKHDNGNFKFNSPKGNELDIKAKFDLLKGTFEIKVKGVNNISEISGTTLIISLHIGANVGEDTVEMESSRNHLEYKAKPKLDCYLTKDTPAPVPFSCFGLNEVKLETKDERCKGIKSLQVTSIVDGEELVSSYLPEAGKDKLHAHTVVDDGVNGPVEIHTSCSQPLDVGDIFGAYTVTDLTKIHDDQHDNRGNEVMIKGTFKPAVLIDLAVDDVTCTIKDLDGYFAELIIPAGSFKVEGKHDNGKLKFDSPKGSSPEIQARLDIPKGKFDIKVKGFHDTNEINGTTLVISLQLGANVGEDVVEMQNKPNHLEYKAKPKLDCYSTVPGTDTVPPVIFASLVNDTGRADVTDSYTDGITNDPSISGVVSDNSGIVSIAASIDATALIDVTGSINTDGSFVFNRVFLEGLRGSNMTDGSYTLCMQAEDEHGNVSEIFNLPFVLDTTAPNVETLDLRASSDTGINSVDNITNDNSPTLDIDTEIDALVELSIDSFPFNQSTIGPMYSFTTGLLSDGIYDFTATAQDIAGNLGTSSALSVQIDTVAPDITLLLNPASDTGTEGDDITAMALVVLNGKTEPAMSVELAPMGATVISDINGEFTFAGIPLTMGANPCTATVTDIAGNIGQAERTITRIEIIPPIISASLVNDTGRTDQPSSYADGITSDLSISGVVSDDSGVASVSAAIDAAALVNVSGSINADGSFIFDRAFLEGLLGGTMTDGSYALRMQAVDVYGNTSGIFTLPVTLDTIAPIVEVPDLRSSSDTGSSNADNITNDSTPAIDVDTEAGALVALLVDASSAGQNTTGPLYEFIPGPLADGLHNVTATAQDIAGNLGTSSAMSVLIDTVAPPVDFALAEESDTDEIGDSITTLENVTLIANTETNTAVSLFYADDMGSPLASGLSDLAGQLRFENVVLDMGDNNFAVTAVDLAGNLGMAQRTIVRENNTIYLIEGTDFTVEHIELLTIHEQSSALGFVIEELVFDTTDDGFINDAFEVSLIDSNGNVLAPPFALDRDVCLNMTEEQDSLLGTGTEIEASNVTVDLSHLAIGTEFNVLFRLVNNDSDTQSYVQIKNVQVSPYLLPAISTNSFTFDAHGLAQDDYSDDVFYSADEPLNVMDNKYEVATSSLQQNHWIFDTKGDYDTGTYLDVNADQNDGGLMLNSESTVLPFIWIPNNNESVSKIDVITGKELGRYVVCPPGVDGNPSRTTVDLDGNCWVANRYSGSVIKIGLLENGEYIDRNGNGIADTSRDLDGDGDIAGAELLPFGQDECVLFEVIVIPGKEGTFAPGTYSGGYTNDWTSPGPRGVAIDKNNDLWLGTHGTMKYFRIDGKTGVIQNIYDVSSWSHNPYGAVIDANHALWSSCLGGNHVLRIDTNNPSDIRKIDLGHHSYGLALDSLGHLFVNGWETSRLTRINTDTLAIDWTKSKSELYQGRGVAVTQDNDVWAVSSANGTVSRYDNDGNHIMTISVGSTPTGVAVDTEGKVWVCNNGDEYIKRIDPSTNSIDLSKAIVGSGGHYSYSDMTGAVVRNLTALTGTWTKIIDSNRYDTVWGAVAIEAEIPQGSSVTISVRSDNDESVLSQRPWMEVESGQSLEFVQGQYLQIEIKLRAGTLDESPVIDMVEVISFAPPIIRVDTPVDGGTMSPQDNLLLAGKVFPDNPLLTSGNSISNMIRRVLINGQPVLTLDTAGNFFSKAAIYEGKNEFTITAFDDLGQTTTKQLTVIGKQPSSNSISTYGDEDLTASVLDVYATTSLYGNTDLLYVDLSLQNPSQFAMGTPLRVGIINISHPSVTVANPDGITEQRIPYFDYTDLLDSGKLWPGDSTGYQTLAFHNPDRVQFTYDLIILGSLNHRPMFSSIPELEVIKGKPYSYDADAMDPDDDVLKFSLIIAPSDMTIDSETGQIFWDAILTNTGNHTVQVKVEDGNGGYARQDYLLSVRDDVANRPPVFISVPVVEAQVASEATWQDTPFDLSQFSFQYIPETPLVPNWVPEWVISSTGDSVEQINNAYASFFLSNFDLEDTRIRGSWQVHTLSDDDWMGFVFGFQDPQHFYVFDWKATDQNHGTVVDAKGLAGMTVKLVDADSPLEIMDLWNTDGTVGRVTPLYHNDIPWVNFTEYQFTLDFHPGQFTITVLEGETVLDTITIADSTYTSGKFGFYNYSQGEVLYSGFRQQTIAEITYRYDADAVDPDQDDIAYTLVQGPDDMMINESTGEITWNPTIDQIGNHPVTVEANDSRGGVAIQSFEIAVLPDPDNNDPIIISDPVTTMVPGEEYVYDVEAIDPDDDPLTYMLTEGPSCMDIDPDSGLITWPGSSGGSDFAINVGSSGQDLTYGVATDCAGNVYSTGLFTGTVDFDPGPETYYRTSDGGWDIFIQKVDPYGNLIWAYRIGSSGNGEDVGYGIAVDGLGNVYVTGWFEDTVDFDPGDGEFYLTSLGSWDGFVCKLDTDGNFMWAVNYGSPSNDRGVRIEVDIDHNVYVAGWFTGTVDFDPGDDEFYLTAFGASGDPSILKLDSNGNFLWAANIKVSEGAGVAVAIDSTSNVYVTGYFIGSADFDPGLGVHELTSTGGPNSFVWKLDSNGNLVWARNYDGAGLGITIDNSGDIYVANGTYDSRVPLEGSVLKIDAEGNTIWSYYIESTIKIPRVKTDSLGHVYVSGVFTESLDIDSGEGVRNITCLGGEDSFVMELDSNGNFITVNHFGGGGNWDKIFDIVLDNFGNIIIGGNYNSNPVTFDAGYDTFTLPIAGGYDGFLIKYQSGHIPNFDVGVRVEDGRGGFDEQSFTIGIQPEVGNRPPEIISDAVTTLVPGQDYVYDVEAIDPDDDPLTYMLTKGPSCMDIDPDTGLITWPGMPEPDSDFAFSMDTNNSLGGTLYGIDSDCAGNIYSTVVFEGTVDSDPGPGVHELTSFGYVDLVIQKTDPHGNLLWAYQIGSSGYDAGYGIKVDESGDVYVTGWFEGTVDFDSGPGVFNLSSIGGTDGFVCKLDTDGNFIWAGSFGSHSNDRGHKIDVDSDHNVYTTGIFEGTADFDPGSSEYNLTAPSGGQDVYVLKLDSNGNFLWAANAGSNNGRGNGMAVDDANNVYITGSFMGTVDFDPGDGVYELTSCSGYDSLFLWKLDPDGNLIWVKQQGGCSNSGGTGIAIDNSGDIYVSNGGYTYGRSVTGSAIKYNADGDLLWSWSLGGNNRVWAIATDSLGHVYVGAQFGGTVDVDPGPGVYNITSLGGVDSFVAELDSNGNFISASHIGGVGEREYIYALSLDNFGNIMVGGAYRNGSITFYAGGDTLAIPYAGDFDMFLIKYKSGHSPNLDVGVRVEDGRGGFDEQSFTLNICEDPADLVISDVDTSSLLYDGQALTVSGEVSAAVTNLGPTDVSIPFDVLFFEDRDYNGVYDQGIDSFLGQATISDPLAVDETTIVFAELTGSVLFSGNIVWGFVDSGNVICETNENNNYTTSGQEPDSLPPAFTSIPPTNATIGQLYRYDSMAVDPDGDELTFDLPTSPAGMAVVADSGIAVWTPGIDQLGWQNVLLRVSDGRGGIDLQSFQITVGMSNTPPVITSPPSTTAAVDVLYEYDVQAQDGEGDQLTFELSTAPVGITIDPLTGLISWTPAASQAGTHTISVMVSDGLGGTASQNYDLSVVAVSVNESPHIISTPRMITEVGLSYAYQVEATDGNGDSLTYSLSTAPVGMTINPAGLVQWIPTTWQFGLNDVYVLVTDGRGGAAYQEFSVNVVLHAVNNPPAITTVPVFVAALGQSYVYNSQATDPDGDPIVWSLETAPAGMSADPLQGTVRWTPTAAQLGINEVVLKVIDAQGAWASQVYTVNVQTVNTPPNITSTPLANAYVGYQYTYAVNAVDPESNTLVYSLTASPAGMTIDPATGMLQWTPSAGQIGPHSVVIRAEDTAGGYATQSYAIEVIADVPNNPPTITSMPSGLAIADALYQYEVQAVDPESDAITFTLEIAPAGMTIDPATGLIQWTSTLAQIGDNFVKIVATDTAGNAAFQSFAISVVNGNNHPVITSAPQSPAFANDTWAYDVTASDPDGDSLSYSLEQAPAGMTVDEFGRVRWTPTATDVGPHTVEVLAADIYGAAASQTFTLTVVIDTSLPTISLVVNENPIALGSDLIITAWATDNVGIESMFVTFDDTPVTLNVNGQAALTMDAFGAFEIAMTATDTSGNERSGSLTINVFDPNPDPNPPFVEITSPAYGDAISNITDVIGTVEDDDLSYYILEIARADEEVYTEIARGTTTVTEDLLGKFDPTVLANDTYLLSLTAVDTSGNTSYSTIEVNVEGSLKIGNFTLSFTDLSIPVSGIPITVTRTYDSLNANTQNDLGYGWRLELKDTDLTTNIPDTGYEDMGFFNAFYYGSKVYVTTPDGKRQGFTFIPEPPRDWGESFLGIYHPAFTPDSGVTSRLNVEDIYLQYVESTGEFIFYGSGWAYNPADTEFTNGTYTLSTAEGINYTIDALDGDLNVISETNGNSLTFADDAVISSSGPRVEFERDPSGRITAVIDPAGNRVEYGYDANDDLVSVTDREGNVTEFVYLSDPAHYLDQIIDPLGRTGIRNEYDEQGRIIRMIDVNGNAVELVHDPDNFIETVVDSLGNATIYEYDDRGNVLTEVDALGNTKRYSYDNNNHSLTETDPLGNITTYTRDGTGNALTVTDPLGNTTYNTYGTYNRLLTTTDPLGNTTTNAYDGSGNLLSTTDAVGNVTTYTYDSSGNQTSVTDALGNTTTSQYDSSGNMIGSTDPLGNTTTYTYDVNGNMISQTDALGNTTTYTYNTNGQVVSTTDALGNVTTTEYNEIGKEVAKVDALGNRTESVYDNRGQLIQTIGPEGSIVQTEYDAAGRRISSTNPLGQTTQYEYDALGRTLRTVNPDGSASQTEYDAAGRSIAMINALGNRTEFEYDAAGRVIATDYPDGTSMQVKYDTAGRRISSTDRAGQTTIYEYDALGRTIQTILPDGSSSHTEYDAAGRTIAQVNALGNRSEYVFDAAGRNTSVIDALGNVTEYAYDATGRRISMTDANGNTTTFAYDALGRQIQTNYPDGTSAAITYDAIGKKVAETDQAGSASNFEYDSMGRLIGVTDALGNQTTYTYDDAGNRLTQTDANGNTTSFEYDSMNRQISHIMPMGQSETMQYNAAGSMISKTDFNGDTITRQYDSSNRLISKNLPDGTSVEFTYTSTGQQQTISDSRGLTTFGYDPMGRLISQIDPNDASISYTYDQAGNRTSVTTASGTTAYTFDSLNRLETVTGLGGGVTAYAYDAVGNRSIVVYPNGTAAEYTYDSLNRLIYMENRKSTGEVISSYAYTLGSAGNRTKVTEDTGRTVDYIYDSLYRLIEEHIDDPASGITTTIAYTYDAVGNRLSRSVTTDSSETITTYTYDNNDRLLTEDQSITYSQLMISQQDKYYAKAHGVSAKPSAASAYMMDGLLSVSLVGLFLPFGLLLPWGKDISRRERRRRIMMLAIMFLTVPMFGIGHENVLAASTEANLYNAMSDPMADLTEAVSHSYTYDENGNTLTKTDGINTDTYTYDYENHMISADIRTGTVPVFTTYTYDADGIRTSKTADSVTIAYTVDKNRPYAQVLEEYDGTETVSYVYGDDLISMTRPTGTSYYHYDGHMSTRHLTDNTETSTDTYTYDAFGNLLASTGTTINNYRYTGEQYDPNAGFYYLRARYYNQSVGRFTSMDPFHGFTADPMSLHKYLYAHANPVMNLDPSGLFTLADMMMALNIRMKLAIQEVVVGVLRIGYTAFRVETAIKPWQNAQNLAFQAIIMGDDSNAAWDRYLIARKNVALAYKVLHKGLDHIENLQLIYNIASSLKSMGKSLSKASSIIGSIGSDVDALGTSIKSLDKWVLIGREIKSHSNIIRRIEILNAQSYLYEQKAHYYFISIIGETLKGLQKLLYSSDPP